MGRCGFVDYANLENGIPSLTLGIDSYSVAVSIKYRPSSSCARCKVYTYQLCAKTNLSYYC